MSALATAARRKVVRLDTRGLYVRGFPPTLHWPGPKQSETMKALEKRLSTFALSYPGTHEDFPWGERVVKVRKKVFVFLRATSRELHMTVKLPSSGTLALSLPFAKPTGYGLGRSGWVTSTFGARNGPPPEVLMQWIDESYRAVAPKKLVAALPASGPPARGGSKRTTTARKPAARARPRRR
jgi:predicted DNA-binding protein (MmcQ/YjbR family)